MVQELYFIYKKTAFSKMEKARNRNKFIKELCLKKLGIERWKKYNKEFFKTTFSDVEKEESSE